MVTTHELGHNFGAEHDPDSIPECAPKDYQGGKFVMYPIAVSGDHVNNKVLHSQEAPRCAVQLQMHKRDCFFLPQSRLSPQKNVPAAALPRLLTRASEDSRCTTAQSPIEHDREGELGVGHSCTVI